jgi:phosphocarrier protein FPr
MNKSTLELLAPLSGVVIPIEQVPDPVFSQKLVGDGVAIDPTDHVLRAPCAGKIVQLHSSLHAVSIESDSGVQVLLHIGIDTVGLKGQGFSPKVRVGDRVEAGQPLIEFDPDQVAKRARSLISVMVIAEAPAPHQLSVTLARTARVGESCLLTVSLENNARAASAVTAADALQTSEPIRLKLPAGLHARPAALVVREAKKFTSEVRLRKGERLANAKSVVAILGLGISPQDSIQVEAQGADATSAVAGLSAFLNTLEEQAHEVHAAASSTPAPVSSAPRTGSAQIVLGVSASPGLALGRIHQLRTQRLDFAESLKQALTRSHVELEVLKVQVAAQSDATQAAIFSAHQELLEDPDLVATANTQIDQGFSAAYAWNEATESHAKTLAALGNELMANRAADLRDVGRRVLRQLLAGSGASPASPAGVTEQYESNTILIAETLTPSDTAQLDRSKILGFATITGGATSHVAILARSLGLPALAGLERRALMIADGTEAILDGDRGEIRLNPTEAEKAEVRSKQAEALKKRESAQSRAVEPAVTRDGHRVEIAANITGVEDARRAVELGADGVGLLRTEFLFHERETAPSEEEQYRIYQEVSDVLGNRPLVIRTLDVGGDKPLQYLPIPAEENPFLGVRGIRVGFLRPEILREQLRAILRVKTLGTLHVMFPMISMVEEFRQAKAILEEERAKLGASAVKVGLMIETPAAALIADALAREADFFSIGTNDLTQYTLAMDRGHPELAKKCDGLHPSVLKLIELTVQAAHRHGRWVGVCGGIAGETAAVPVLVGLGVDELSVSVPSVPMIKSQVRDLALTQSQALAASALTQASSQDVRGLSEGLAKSSAGQSEQKA